MSHQTTFLLSRYGTWEKAEAAAARWVKVKLKELPPPTPVKDRKTQRNTSGVVGVRLANATRSKNGRVYEDWRWVAFWPGCPKSGGIGWSVKKYGDKHAFVCAYIARNVGIGQARKHRRRSRAHARHRAVQAGAEAQEALAA